MKIYTKFRFLFFNNCRDFSRQIRLKCDLIRKGQLSPCAPDYQFCQTVTSSEFDKQRTKQTKAELLQLLKSVEESDMPQKKKERLIMQLQSMHGIH